MDLVDQTKKLIKRLIEKLESKIRNIEDLYYSLRQCIKFWL